MIHMTLIWHGHSCFTVESDGYRVALDPYTVESYPPLHISAHEVLCSHGHRDHSFTEAVELLPRAGKSPFTVETVPCFHDEQGGALRGENKIHILRAEGLRVVHCGDLGHALTPTQLDALRGCDALLLPVGGYYTIDANAAKTLCDAVSPRVVMPMHYRFGAHGYDVLATLADFLPLFPPETVQRLHSNSFTLTKTVPAGVVVPAFAE